MRAVVVSLTVHAGIAAGFVAGAGGHAPAGTSLAAASAPVIELDPAAEAVEAPAPIAPTDEVRPEETTGTPHPPGHTHPYPVPVDHDARPHDPSQPHDHGGDLHHEPGPSEAPPVVVDETPMRRVFAMANGSGSMAPGSTRVAAAARGRGPDAPPASDGREATTYGSSMVSVPAKLVAAATATYPQDARADEAEGEVGLEIVVDAAGRVVDARVVKQAGHGFDESALAAIRGYRFSPAQRDGQAVRVRMSWTVEFRLR